MQSIHLPYEHPISRARRIADLVIADAKQAISCHACFVAANDAVRDLAPDGGPVMFADAATFNIAHYAQLAYLSLLLARLFDPGPQDKALQRIDIASIPILMRYLAMQEVREHFAAKAREWTPHLDGMEDAHTETVETAVRDTLAAWDAIQATPEGAVTLGGYKRFRNQVLAHTLDITKAPLPVVNDALRLVDGLIPLVTSLSLIFRGEHWQAANRHRIDLNQGRAFWRRALKANHDAVNAEW